MNIGDLVMMIKYQYWGIGIILAFDEDGTAFVRWADGRGGWRYNRDLEVL